MKNFNVFFTTGLALLSLSGSVWADGVCPALTAVYTSPSTTKSHNLPGAKVFATTLSVCRPHGRAQSNTAATGGRYTAFDVPGANSSGPQPTAINNAGMIVGYYFDEGNLIHSFLRTPQGIVTTFDPPGATCSVATSNVCSTANGINAEGVISGSFTDASGTHGYLRFRNGSFKIFDVPGSANYTAADNINVAGTVVGIYVGSDNTFHGFLRYANGAFTSFDPPGSVSLQSAKINLTGAIAGSFMGADSLIHGFLRYFNGNIVTFNAPDGGFLTTLPAPTLNAETAVTGSFCSDAACSNVHGFLRMPNGTLKTIDAPGGNYATIASGINSAGAITGWYIPSDFSASRGYVRTWQGKFLPIDPPGSGFTMPLAINELGTIVGNYCDPAVTACHGFVFMK